MEPRIPEEEQAPQPQVQEMTAHMPEEEVGPPEEMDTAPPDPETEVRMDSNLPGDPEADQEANATATIDTLDVPQAAPQAATAVGIEGIHLLTHRENLFGTSGGNQMERIKDSCRTTRKLHGSHMPSVPAHMSPRHDTSLGNLTLLLVVKVQGASSRSGKKRPPQSAHFRLPENSKE